MTMTNETLAEAPESLESWWDAGVTWDHYLAVEIEEHIGSLDGNLPKDRDAGLGTGRAGADRA